MVRTVSRLGISLFLFFIAFYTLPVWAALRQLDCQVMGVSDGDTLTCLQHRKALKIRLQHIDAPESAQPFGQRAKQALATLAFKKRVKIEVSGYDRYQRLLGVVYDERGKNLNLILVKQGMAWAYRQTESSYQQAETEARSKRLGLWQDTNPINPADWRASRHSMDLQKNQKNRSLDVPQSQKNCAVQRSCRQMVNFAEALAYFQQCGWKALDGNNDGIPCNKLYRKAQQR